MATKLKTKLKNIFYVVNISSNYIIWKKYYGHTLKELGGN